MEFVFFGVSTFRTRKQPFFHSAGFSIIDAGNFASLITNTLQAAWLRENMCDFKITLSFKNRSHAQQKKDTRSRFVSCYNINSESQGSTAKLAQLMKHDTAKDCPGMWLWFMCMWRNCQNVLSSRKRMYWCSGKNWQLYPFEEERDTTTATEGLTGIELPGCFYPKLIALTLPTDP